MAEYAAACLAWIRANPALFVTLVWPAYTGLLSLVYRRANSNPRLHAFFQACISYGLDIPAGNEWLKRFLLGPQPPSLGVLGAPAVQRRVESSRPPPPPPANSDAYERRPRATCLLDRLGVAIGVVALGALVGHLAACEALRDPKTQAEVTDATATTLCVVKYLVAGDTPAQIVGECSGATVKLVMDILAAQQDGAAMSEARARAMGQHVDAGRQ